MCAQALTLRRFGRAARAAHLRVRGFAVKDEHDTFAAGFHELPPVRKLKRMSFSELAIELQEHAPGSAAYLVVQREMGLKANPSLWAKPWFVWLAGLTSGVIGTALVAWLKHAFFP